MRNPTAPDLTQLPRPEFDALGTNLLYMTGDASRPRAVLRRLSDGHDFALDSGPGILWRAAFTQDGKYVLMRIIDRDTNGDGVLRAPVTHTDRSRVRLGPPPPCS